MDPTLNWESWFTEAELPFAEADVRISLRTNGLIFEDQNAGASNQHVQVFDTPFHGRMLALDGIIQVAEKDEFIYHEMMVALPAVKHGNPRSVLVIGGGDGGAIKQALCIEGVERVVLVEIEDLVIETCKKYLPSIADGAFDDERLEVVIADGMKYVEETDEKFDIVALDLTDPIPEGPAAGLYEEPFYRNVRNVLNPGGVVATHCSSLVIQPEEAAVMIPRLKGVFDEVTLHTAVVPTYQLTSFGFLIARPEAVPLTPEAIAEGFARLKGPLQYLSPDIFEASQQIPPYIAKQIGLEA